MTKQAKALGAKLRIAKGEGSEEEESGDEAARKQRERLWGKSKRSYYDADNIDLEVGGWGVGMGGAWGLREV